MNQITEQKRLRPWMGFVLFAVMMAFFVFVCVPLQSHLGIPGLVLTELGILAIAVIFCLIRKVSIKEVFPIRKVTVKDIFGCIFLLMGGFFFSIISVALTATIIPSSTSEAEGLSNALYGTMGYFVTVLVVAVLPAICEESIHRGAILSCFRGLKWDWVIILITAAFFSINHLSVLRCTSTLILGICLGYVVVKKDNILLSMLMHFTNNFFSASIGYISSKALGGASTASVDYGSALGVYLILGCAAPIFLVLGVMLLCPESHKKIRFLYAGLLTAAMLIVGIVWTGKNFSSNALMSSTVSAEVTASKDNFDSMYFDVTEERTATIVVAVTNASGDYTVRIDGDKGSNIINADVPQGAFRMMTYNVTLQPDHYTVTIIPGDNAVGEQPMIQITIK